MDRLNQWLSLIANIGVLVGVFVVAYELQQNTAVATAQATFQINASVDPAYRAIAQNPELAQLISTGNNNPDALNEVENEQFAAWFRAEMNTAEATWFYYVNGLIPEGEFDGYQSAICSRVTTKGQKANWQRQSKYFADGFQAVVTAWCFES